MWATNFCPRGEINRSEPKWRKLVILSEQSMPTAMPSLDEKCPAIIHIEGGLLNELGDIFYSLLCDFTMPEGIVLLIGPSPF
jgi:hypothetical protein